ncbi:glycoside hydrolase family 3 C-terminal domain-containing protein [Arthrobacter sp. NPDC056691]|uniref:beta-glucosidase n=1 Tax=Arthrobacter sp. NPDC056691 TaxID=3345913 RepID=UPI003670C3AB
MNRKKKAHFSFEDGVRAVRAGTLTPADVAERLITQMTNKELLWMLDGDVPLRAIITLPAKIKAGPIAAGAIPRLGIPGVQFVDGPRGVVAGASTAFPVTISRGATWDPELEEAIGLAMGLEGRAQGANYSGAVCINLIRHPAWGRAQESYGDDPVLLGQMGAALTRGLQRNVIACVKHYALNSMENARFKVDVTADAHALHEVYLPHFKTVIDAGAESVMSSYNSVNGEWAGDNKVLLTDILRDEWGFEGFVTSDWASGIHDAVRSLDAGLDIEMPLRMHRARELPKAIAQGLVSKESLHRPVRRILSTLVRHAAARDQIAPPKAVLASPAHRALARRAGAQGAVLLKNDPVEGAALLPLDPSIRRLAVIGALAVEANMGDHGSSLVHPPSSSSPLDGLREALPTVSITHVDGTDLAEAREAAASADLAIVVAGMSFDDEGERVENEEPSDMPIFGWPMNTLVVGWLLKKIARLISQFGKGGDRTSLTLHERDERLIRAVVDTNPRTIPVIIGGSAIIMEKWRHDVPAILMAWYPGMEGGRAIADVLTGAQEPGGRLPLAIPKDAAHLPFFDASASEITYDAWWGQRKLDRDGNRAAYPFGYGLGYTTFEMELIEHHASDADGVATVRVRNTGARAGSTVAQVYAVETSGASRVPQLIGFRRVRLAPGAETVVEVALDLSPTRERDPSSKTWSRRRGNWQLICDAHSPADFNAARPLYSDATSR